MPRNSDQDKAWPPNTPGAQEAKGDIQQLTPTTENNTQGLGDNTMNVWQQILGPKCTVISDAAKSRGPVNDQQGPRGDQSRCPPSAATS